MSDALVLCSMILLSKFLLGRCLSLLRHYFVRSPRSAEVAECVHATSDVLPILQAEEALQLIDTMLELDALPQLVYRLRHFNESVPEEAEATQKLLSVFENMIEIKPEVAEQLVQLGDNKTGFLRSA